MFILSAFLNFSICVTIFLVFLKYEKSFSVYSPLFAYLAFHLFVFILWPLISGAYGYSKIYDKMGISPNNSLLIRTHCATLVGLLFFTIGYYLVTAGRNWTRGSFEKKFPLDNSFSLLVIVLSLCFPLILYSIVYSVRAGHNVSFVDGKGIVEQGSGYLLDAQNMAIGMSLLLLLCRSSFKIGVSLLVVFIIGRMLQGYGRQMLLFAILVPIVFYFLRKRIRFPSTRVGLVIVLSVLLVYPAFVALGAFRDGGKVLLGLKDESSYAEFRRKDGVDYRDNQDFANFQYLTYIIDTVPDLSGDYSYGIQHLMVFLEPVPRKIWPEKPTSLVEWNLNDYGNFLGLTPSMVGDGWMSGGFIGVSVTMLIWGAFSGMIYRHWCLDNGNLLQLILYSIFITVSIIWYRDGEVTSLVKKFLILSLPVFIFVLLRCGWKLLKVDVKL
ncbi:hypothetical protein [Roseibacillus ishigakijimensis]|uniref:Oligosaccharide repeat unit polymerase n=1 Tax=Roseibacillus ishigakijimensis TaxID=454146 RepID=A0A934VLV8_9BACT|nr:hypothetical protein [Roseibacillus ishigakijimensis]MBK1833642.1 hypothetical protein [Roseibacillus ishigakijimensis]